MIILLKVFIEFHSSYQSQNSKQTLPKSCFKTLETTLSCTVHIKRRYCSDLFRFTEVKIPPYIYVLWCFCIFMILMFVFWILFVFVFDGFVWIGLLVCVLSSSLPLSYSQRVSLSLYWEPNKRYLEFWKEPLVGLLLSHSLKNTASLPLACWI